MTRLQIAEIWTLQKKTAVVRKRRNLVKIEFVYLT